MIKTKRLDGKRLHIVLTGRLEADMRSFCRDKGIESESELVRNAIAQYIYADYSDETFRLQGMKQILNEIKTVHDMVEVLFYCMEDMHISTLAYHPEIDKSMVDAAFASAINRHNKFLDAFRNSLKNRQPSFLERLLHDFFTGNHNGQN